MNEKKMRALDVFLAEKALGYVWRKNKCERGGTYELGGGRGKHITFPVGAHFLVPKDEKSGFYAKPLADGFSLRGETFYWVPRFTAHLGPAMLLVNTMSRYVNARWQLEQYEGFWTATFSVSDRRVDCGRGRDAELPLAICLAAKQAFGE